MSGTIEESPVCKPNSVRFKIGYGIAQVEVGHVHPRKISRFMLVDANLWNALFNERVNKVAIGSEIAEEFLSPGATVPISGFTGSVAEIVDLCHDPSSRRIEPISKTFIGDNGQRAAKSGQIVGLARSDKGEGVF